MCLFLIQGISYELESVRLTSAKGMQWTTLTCIFYNIQVGHLPLLHVTAVTRDPNRVVSKCTRMAIMPILASEALFRENKKKIGYKMLP